MSLLDMYASCIALDSEAMISLEGLMIRDKPKSVSFTTRGFFHINIFSGLISIAYMHTKLVKYIL